MKKAISLFVLVLIILTSLTGCSSNKKSEEEMKAQIKEELKAEMAMEQAQKDNSSTSSSDTANDTANDKVELLEMYEVNKEYKYDLDGNEVVDTFSIDTDNMNYFDIIIGEEKYSLNDFIPELVFNKFKLTKMDDSNRYALTFFVASPPNEQEVYFYEFAEGSGLNKIGVVTSSITSGNELFDYDIKYLSYDQVKIGDDTFSLGNS